MTKNAGEVEFFRDAGVTVTNTRFATSGQTIAMSGVTSVSISKDPIGVWEVGSLLVGLPMLYWGFSSADARPVIFLGLALVGFAIWLMSKPMYTLILTSTSGKQRLLKTKNKVRLNQIAAAVREAIIHRG